MIFYKVFLGWHPSWFAFINSLEQNILNINNLLEKNVTHSLKKIFFLENCKSSSEALLVLCSELFLDHRWNTIGRQPSLCAKVQSFQIIGVQVAYMINVDIMFSLSSQWIIIFLRKRTEFPKCLEVLAKARQSHPWMICVTAWKKKRNKQNSAGEL